MLVAFLLPFVYLCVATCLASKFSALFVRERVGVCISFTESEREKEALFELFVDQPAVELISFINGKRF